MIVGFLRAKRPNPTNRTVSQNTSTTRNGQEIEPRAAIRRVVDRRRHRGLLLRLQRLVGGDSCTIAARSIFDFRRHDPMQQFAGFARVLPQALERAIELE